MMLTLLVVLELLPSCNYRRSNVSELVLGIRIAMIFLSDAIIAEFDPNPENVYHTVLLTQESTVVAWEVKNDSTSFHQADC